MRKKQTAAKPGTKQTDVGGHGRNRVCAVLLALALMAQVTNAQDQAEAKWLGPQNWIRDTQGPVLSLGKAGAFDDQHIFAPCVWADGKKFWLWYCGSRGTVADRVFGMGLATSLDGNTFERHANGPVLKFADQRHSVLTPTLATDGNGTPIREQGKLRLWFSSTDFHDPKQRHTLHMSESNDGVHWSEPSAAQLEGVYAPTVLKEGDRYRLWYTDVTENPWVLRYAESKDGTTWEAAPEPVLRADQPWEQDRLFYPTVRKADDLLLMWYGSYWRGQGSPKTALGFAVSRDGRNWTKSPHNPVFRPDEKRAWESHYVTSQSVVRLKDGTWQMWYASRTKPPFVHKYFAIGTAKWAGPQ